MKASTSGLTIKICAGSIALVLAALPAGVVAYEEQLTMVWVTGVRSNYTISYDSSIVYQPIFFHSAFRPWRTRMAIEEYQEARQAVIDAVKQRLKSTDVRCNSMATSDTKNTSSRNDLTDRFLAANQLLTAISAVEAGQGARDAIAGSPPKMYEGKLIPTFTVTYNDGGKETWGVATLVPVTLLWATNFPPAPDGDGVAKPCPIPMQG